MKIKKKKPQLLLQFFILCRHRLIFPGRFQPSIVSTDELNYRVRDGNGWTLIAKNTDYVCTTMHPFHSVLVLYTKRLRLSIGFIKLFNIFLLERFGCAQIVQFVCRKGRISNKKAFYLDKTDRKTSDSIYK